MSGVQNQLFLALPIYKESSSNFHVFYLRLIQRFWHTFPRLTKFYLARTIAPVLIPDT